MTMCRSSLARAEAKPLATPTPTVTLTQSSTGSWIATIDGNLTGGAHFTSDIELVRLDDGDIRAVDPIYWIQRKIPKDGD